MDCSYERLARQRLGYPKFNNDGQPRAFFGKVIQVFDSQNEIRVELRAFRRTFVVKARGKCGTICKALLMPGRCYTFSGWERRANFIEITMLCEISRPKPPFTKFDVLYEKLVNVDFLHRMAATRNIVTESEICDLHEERYYVQGVILGYDAWPRTYKGCNNPECYAAKVDVSKDFYYTCPKCENESEDYDPTLLAKIMLVDPERLPLRPVQDCFPRRGRAIRPPVITVAVFKETAESLLGRTTNELVDLMHENEEEFKEVCGRAISRKLVFRLRANVFNGSICYNMDCVFP